MHIFDGELRSRLRLGSALVMLSFVVCHLAAHSVLLVSESAATSVFGLTRERRRATHKTPFWENFMANRSGKRVPPSKAKYLAC